MSLHIISTQCWQVVGESWNDAATFEASWPGLLSPVRSGTSTPCRGFRKSGAFSDLTGGTTKTYLCLWSLNHCQKSCSQPLPTASCLVTDLLRDRTRCSPFLTCDMDGSHVKLLKKEDYFLLFGKSPRHLVPACFVPQVSQRMSVSGLLISSLLYFVDQPHFCWVSGRQVQLYCHFGPALHSFQVFWCALWELIVLPMPKMLCSMSYFPADS